MWLEEFTRLTITSEQIHYHLDWQKPHEQVSDTFMEGETQPAINNINGKDIELKSEELDRK